MIERGDVILPVAPCPAPRGVEPCFLDFRLEAFQPEGVAYYGDGAHGHGCGGDHGVEKDAPEGIEDPGGNGNSQNIVDEGPEQVLLDRTDGSLA